MDLDRPSRVARRTGWARREHVELQWSIGSNRDDDCRDHRRARRCHVVAGRCIGEDRCRRRRVPAGAATETVSVGAADGRAVRARLRRPRVDGPAGRHSFGAPCTTPATRRAPSRCLWAIRRLQAASERQPATPLASCRATRIGAAHVGARAPSRANVISRGGTARDPRPARNQASEDAAGVRVQRRRVPPTRTQRDLPTRLGVRRNHRRDAGQRIVHGPGRRWPACPVRTRQVGRAARVPERVPSSRFAVVRGRRDAIELA